MVAERTARHFPGRSAVDNQDGPGDGRQDSAECCFKKTYGYKGKEITAYLR